PEALVMTSGNLSEEPIAYTNEDARERLARLADAFLMHDRDIYVRCDDSVVRELESGAPAFLRRSRGYAPGSLPLPWDVPPLLATGAELKNTFCLARDRYAFLSHHIGDLENYETLRSFEDSIAHFERLFHVTPQALAYDLHPNYLATRYALERAQREGLPAIGVQHHHAHIAACMAEHGLPGDEPIIGVSFDGTGYGPDETTGAPTIWGGEFLIAGYGGFRRAAHLAYIPLPGGDRAVKEPWRIALAWLQAADAGWDATLPPVAYGASLAPYALDALAHQLQSGVNAPPTSSMGRLFDAVAALAGVRQTVNYEAQAAVELEALVDPQESGSYPFALNGSIVDPVPAIAAVAEDVRAGTSLPVIAARFHNGVAQMVAAVCCDLRERSGLNAVALSGGVWQNMTLLRRTLPLLAACGFTVYVHRRVPANDGGLALGQAAILGWHLNNKEKR
ncbi:MAG: carbamoyltransferase HypF, partial [Chloroflexi bacterium]|nr:carbamoyltransferase HypF [Chloroflexota bacterium]